MYSQQQLANRSAVHIPFPIPTLLLARPGLNYPEKRRCVTTALDARVLGARARAHYGAMHCAGSVVCVFLVALIMALMERKLRKENMAHNERDLFLRFSSNSSYNYDNSLESLL